MVPYFCKIGKPADPGFYDFSHYRHLFGRSVPWDFAHERNDKDVELVQGFDKAPRIRDVGIKPGLALCRIQNPEIVFLIDADAAPVFPDALILQDTPHEIESVRIIVEIMFHHVRPGGERIIHAAMFGQRADRLCSYGNPCHTFECGLSIFTQLVCDGVRAKWQLIWDIEINYGFLIWL